MPLVVLLFSYGCKCSKIDSITTTYTDTTFIVQSVYDTIYFSKSLDTLQVDTTDNGIIYLTEYKDSIRLVYVSKIDTISIDSAIQYITKWEYKRVPVEVYKCKSKWHSYLENAFYTIYIIRNS